MSVHEMMTLFARKTLGLPEHRTLELVPMAGRGSDRTFFRLSWEAAGSAILIHYDPRRQENTYYADITLFLCEIGIPVPGLLGHDPVQCFMLMEDMGEKDLWSLRTSPPATRRQLYQKTLAVIHRLHSFPAEDFPSGKVRLMDAFGADLYRWERDYFRENFVRDFCGIVIEGPFEKELEKELAALAGRIAGAQRSLVHRDLQSQNVMIRDGEPFLIDFQGMRFGSPFYDLGSLLCDPYMDLTLDEIDDLLSFYYDLTGRDLTPDAFRTCFWEASAQRLMQALGAYGFLGMKKGLKAFLGHIPAGLGNLHRAASRVSTLPRLLELTGRCLSKR